MKHLSKGMVGALAAAIVLVAFAPLTAVPARADVTAVTEEQGATTLLGGGDHRFIRFGDDAAFGVLWGTNATPNNIYLVAVKARYLGVADVTNGATGTTLASDRTIRIYTIYALKLGAIVEFNDLNQDGIANYTRASSGVNYTGYTEAEPLYKYASLTTAWTPSPVNRTDPAPGTRTWSFSLTARNLSYVAIGGSTTNGALDLVTFTFHLTTTVVHVDNATVPKYAITVERQGLLWRITNASRDGSVTWSGDRLQYTVKWDQKIVGWDFHSSNANPALVIEVGAIVANRFPTDLGEWFTAAIVYRLNEDGRMGWRNNTGADGTNETTGYRQPQRLRNNSSIEAGGNWTYIGRLTWASGCTVDNATRTMYAQVQGGIIGAIAYGNATYIGFAVLIGFSFPGGNDIEHDPTVSSDAFVITPTGGGTPSGLGLFVAAIAFVVVLLLILAIVSAGRRRKK